MAIEEKLNCRTLKTRLTIREALLALLKHKELREITIKNVLTPFTRLRKLWTAFTWQMQVANGKRTLKYWLKV